jgi:lipase chaperone LimK
MIQSEQEYRTALQRIERFQRQVEQLRKAETNPDNYRLSASGYLAELDRMQLEVREYLWTHPAERSGIAIAD